jgi:hypothetical protein
MVKIQEDPHMLAEEGDTTGLSAMSRCSAMFQHVRVTYREGVTSKLSSHCFQPHDIFRQGPSIWPRSERACRSLSRRDMQ